MADEINIVYAPKARCCVPAGIYEGQCVEVKRGSFYGQQKLYFKFKIIQGKYAGLEIWMPVNLYRKVARASKYFELWCLANKGIKPLPNDRMSPKIFINKIFKLKVDVVTANRKQQKLSADEQYSIVREIVELCAG